MPSFRKVLGKPESEMSEKEKNSQKEYNKKVKKLKGCVENFKKAIKERKDEISKHTVEKDFEMCFDDYIKSKKLFSRTNKIIKEMYKKIEKIRKDSEEINLTSKENIEAYCKWCFGFKEEKQNQKGYIKRSAIDNPEVIKLFSSIENTFKDVFQKMHEKYTTNACNYFKNVFPNKFNKFKSENFSEMTSKIDATLFFNVHDVFYDSKERTEINRNVYNNLRKYDNKEITKESIENYVKDLGDSFVSKKKDSAFKEKEVLVAFENVKEAVGKKLNSVLNSITVKGWSKERAAGKQKSDFSEKLDSKLIENSKKIGNDILRVIEGLTKELKNHGVTITGKPGTRIDYKIFRNMILDTDFEKFETESLEKKITKIKIECRKPTICKDAFKNCMNLEEIWIPGDLEDIEDGVFVNSKYLKKVHVPKSTGMILPNLQEKISKQCKHKVQFVTD